MEHIERIKTLFKEPEKWKFANGLKNLEYCIFRILRDTKVCTKNERAFLDEIREKFKYNEKLNVIYKPGTPSELYQGNFDLTFNISELVEGKG